MFILTVSENILSFICGVGILQGFLLAVLLYFHPKSDHSVNKFLALFITCLAIIMAGPLLLKLWGWQHGYVVAPVPVLTGPLMYLYIRTFKEHITWSKAFPHIILFFVYIFATTWWLSFLQRKYPQAGDFPPEAFQSSIAYVFFGVRNVQLLVYYFLARRTLSLYQKSIQHMYSETSQINLNWVRWLINGYLLLVIISLVLFTFMIKFPSNFYMLYLVNIAIAVPYIYLITYKGIVQPTIWQKKTNNDKKQIEDQFEQSEEIEKVINEKLTNVKPVTKDSRLEGLVSLITRAMENDRMYQETELTLQNLADKLQFPSYQVSLAINDGMGKSFYDLVNGYRVQEAKRLLLDAKNRSYTILSVGFEAGFNSKTTFNTVFKKFTGLTPTEFRERESVSMDV